MSRRNLAPLTAIAAALTLATAMLTGVLGGVAAAAPTVAAATTAGCGKAPTLASGTRTIRSANLNRSYILRVPDGYDRNRPYRLIFAFHWLNGTAGNVSSAGYYGLQGLSENSAILVAPQGIDNGWANTGGRDLTLVDDLTALIEGD